MKIFKELNKLGYKHYTENTTEELDNLSLDNPDIITEFAHLCEWLRVKHGIWISVVYNSKYKQYDYTIINVNWSDKELSKNMQKEIDEMIQSIFHYKEKFNSPQEAYSAAFDYIQINNLI